MTWQTQRRADLASSSDLAGDPGWIADCDNIGWQIADDDRAGVPCPAALVGMRVGWTLENMPE